MRMELFDPRSPAPFQGFEIVAGPTASLTYSDTICTATSLRTFVGS
jgi:hypothetical protein